MTLDESRENDEIFEVGNYKIAMSKNLAFKLSSVVIRFGGLMSRNDFGVDAQFEEYEY